MTDKTMVKALGYRDSVVAVFVCSRRQRCLVLERYDTPGAWQFPQGGIEEGESAREALQREMVEELGCGKISVLKESEQRVSYDFPSALRVPITAKYKGQRALWFLCRFQEGEGCDLARASDQEFRDFRWVSLREATELTVWWKKDAVMTGLRLLDLDL